jgi:polar amino acid transport system substrate-binding protein
MVAGAVLAFAPALVVAGCGSAGGGGSASPSPASERTITKQQVVELVDATGAALEQDAAGTLAAINAGEAPYVDPANPALYAFVFDTDVRVVGHPEAAQQGRVMKGVPDATGKLFRDQMVASAVSGGSGWVDYVREEPGKEGLYKKRAYFRLVSGSDGKDYVVGAGMYGGPYTGPVQVSPSASPTTAD